VRLRLVKYGSLFVVWLWAFATLAWSAQQPPAAPEPAAAQESPRTPVVIAVTDIIPTSELALTQLRDMRRALEGDQSVGVVEAGLPQFSNQVDEWWRGEAEIIQQLRSVRRTNDVLWQVRLYEGQIADWKALLMTSSEEWSAEKEAMGQLIADWKATQLALDNTTPAAVNSKIAEVLLEGDKVQHLFQEKTEQLVAVQSKLAASLTQVDEIRDAIERVNQQSTSNLFAFESPPLWTTLFATESARPAKAQIGDGSVKLYKEAVRFVQLFQNRLLVHVVLYLVLVALFLRLRQLSRRPSKLMPTDAERLVLDRSYASAFLVASFSVPLLYSDASPQMLRMIVIPSVIPLLMLLPAIFTPKLRAAFHLLTAIYILDFWRYYLPPQWSFVRILLLAEALLGIRVIYLAQKEEILGLMHSRSKEFLIRALLKTGMVLFLAAIIANVLGDLTLAEALFSPLARILYIGVVIRMMTVVATTFALMALRSPLALLLRTVQEHAAGVALNIRRLANTIGVSLWVIIGLFNTGIIGSVLSSLEDVFESTLKLGAVEISVRDIVIFIVVFGSAYVLSRLLRFILAREIFPRFQMPRGVPDALEVLARYGILLFGFVLALISAGVNISQLTLALSALGVGIGFGLQNIVNNFVCGLILVFEHPIQVGDLVEVGQHYGRVQRIGFRSSSLNTPDGGDVIIPNSELIGTRVMNWSLSDQLRRVSLRVPVPMGTDPKRVMDMLLGIARSQRDVVAYPAPNAALETIGDGSLKFVLRCWSRADKFESVSFGLTLAINTVFQDAGIEIPFTQTDVHLHWPEKAGSEIQSVEQFSQMAAGSGTPPKSTAGS